MGFEPMTSSLPRKCSTPELRRLIQFAVTGFQFAVILLPTANCPVQTVTERKTRFELATYSLEGYRSTNWATSAFFSLRFPALS